GTTREAGKPTRLPALPVVRRLPTGSVARRAGRRLPATPHRGPTGPAPSEVLSRARAAPPPGNGAAPREPRSRSPGAQGPRGGWKAGGRLLRAKPAAGYRRPRPDRRPGPPL